jgi:glutamyl-tRNA synthetase
MNGHYIRAMPDDELLRAFETTLPYLPQAAEFLPRFDAAMRAKLLAALPGLKERAKTLVDLAEGARFLFAERPLTMDAKAAEILAAGGQAHLAAILPRLEQVADWSASAIEAVVRVYSEESGAKLGQIAQPLRAALTGRAVSPGIFDLLQVLGRDESLARLRDRIG